MLLTVASLNMVEKVQHTRVKIIFLLASIFLIALSILSYFRIQNLIETGDLINHTQQVKLELGKIIGTLSEIESNERGYMLTKDSVFLQPVAAKTSNLNLYLNNIKTLTKDNPLQQQNLAVLRTAIFKRMEHMNRNLALHTTKVTVESRLQGKVLMDAVRRQVNVMENQEDKLLNVRSESLNKSAFITPLVTIFLILGSIIILIASYLKILKELKTSDRLKINVAEEQFLRKKIEESEQRYHHLIHSSPSAIGILYGEDLVITIANKPIIAIWGKGDEIMGKSYFEALPELAEQGYKDVFAQVYKTGIPFNAVETPVHILQDGVTTLKYYNFILYPQRNINNEVDGIGIIATEVTSQALLNNKIKESEQQYRELALSLETKVKDRTADLQKINETLTLSEERYHRMVGEVQDYAIILLNEQGIIENWNKGAENIKGYKAEEIIGKSFSAFYTAEDQANHVPQKLLALASEIGKATDENWRVRKDGSKFWGSVVITALRDNNKNIIGFVKVTRDLTERKLAEEENKAKAQQLEITNAELQKMNEELKSFTYISSHDLQEPLRQIQNFSSRINSDEWENLSDKAKQYFAKINNAANRMQTLIQDLLAYSRTKITERKYETTDLNKILEEVKEDLKDDLNIKQAVIETNELCDVDIIPFQFRQLMHNLIGNSLKFSRSNITPHIKINSVITEGIKLNNENLSPQKKYCHISVSDNGIGFEPQYKDRIFELFQRLHDKQVKGTGIGLAIAKKIVENHNGIITATGELNKGATFDIYIPSNRN
ncbi:MAG: sensor signal transduction histidine kinase [Bacteroidota bacterium]|nr:sensor signal transduction histidine kinase [Bacteroidota bacterium]